MSLVWAELSRERRSGYTDAIAGLINQELNTDRNSFRVTPKELDGYWAGLYALPPEVAKYADDAAYQNDFVTAVPQVRHRWTNRLVVSGMVITFIGLIGFLIPYPFHLSGFDQYRAPFLFLVPGMGLMYAAVAAEMVVS